MKLNITLKEANNRICEAIFISLTESVLDWLNGDLPENHYNKYFNYRNRVDSIADIKDDQERIKQYTAIALQFVEMYEEWYSDHGYTEVFIRFENNEDDMGVFFDLNRNPR